MALDYAAKRKAPTPLEWSKQSKKVKVESYDRSLPRESSMRSRSQEFHRKNGAGLNSHNGRKQNRDPYETKSPVRSKLEGQSKPMRSAHSEYNRSKTTAKSTWDRETPQSKPTPQLGPSKSEKERHAAYAKPKGSVGELLANTKRRKGRKGRKMEPPDGGSKEPVLKHAEPKNFKEVAKKFSDKSLGYLMSKGRFEDLAALCSAVSAHAPLPHAELLTTLLQLPHGVEMNQVEHLLKTMIKSAEWSSRELMRYFRHLLLPIMDTFMEESQDALRRRLQDRPLPNESFPNLIFTKGLRDGELRLKNREVLDSTGEGRPLDDSDSLWLTRMDREAGVFCECFVVNMSPLVLSGDRENPTFLAAVAGIPCRLDKLAPRTTFSRTLCALHCLAEPPRKVKNKKQQKEGVQSRLPINFAPSTNLKNLLMPEGTDRQRRLWAVEETHLMKEIHLSGIKPSRKLNPSQMDALDSAAANTLTLIQGPPGTGKTTTCVQILRVWALAYKPTNKNTRILATSGSNIAVDNLVEGLLKENIKVVRIGRPESTRPELAESAVENVAAKALGVRSLSEVGYIQRRQALHKAIQEAQVVCCTAVSAGSGLLKEIQFPLVLIDEASQATEPATLVPICHGCKQLVLCGDHCQLPPTVKSDKEHSNALKTSLFERLALSGVQPIMLNIQYRMHTLLSAFPSQQFYDGQLEDAEGKTPAEKHKAWPFDEPLVVAPVFTAEAPKGTSHMNEGEAEVLVDYAEEYLRNGGTEESLGIISPYDSQVKLLRRMLRSRGIRTGLHGVEVNSVDGFQGREKEVIMIGTVRSNLENATGFVRDWRRINVAMTRAKSGLLVVCNPLTLARDSVSWLPWLHWSRWRGLWLNDKDTELPPLRKGGRFQRVGVHSLRSPPRRLPSRSRSPPPNWAAW